MFIVWKIRGPF